MKTNWTISTLDKGISLNCTFHDVVGTYEEAVLAAQQSYRTTGRTTVLRSGGDRSGYWWHCIERGVARDRCTNSGVPTEARL